MRGSVTTSGPIRTHREANGDLHVVADLPSPSFRGSCRVVRAGSDAVRITLGSVEGRIPLVGKEPLTAKKLPLLKLSAGPNGDLLSWVALRVSVDLNSGLMDPENPAAATIVHLNDYALLSVNGLSPDDGQGNGHHSLALIVWRDKTHIRQIVQDSWFSLRHSYRPGTNGERGYHFFRP